MQTYHSSQENSISIGVVGTDYTRAPLSLRERLAGGLGRPVESGSAVDGAHSTSLPAGTVLLSTCHRIEVYFDASQVGADEVVAALARAAQVTTDQLAPHLKVLSGRDAVRHVMEVASGLRSMTLGEGQVLTQVREAFESQATTRSSKLQRLGQIAVRTGKRVRTQTRIGQTYTSLADLAVQRLVELGAEFQGRTVLIVGSGRMARLIARKAISLGIARLKVVCRRPDAFELDAATEAALRGADVGFDVDAMDALEEACAKADVLFSATASPNPVVPSALLERALEGRSRPLYVVDLAVPRDVEPPSGQHPLLLLLTVDDLSSEEEQASALDLERAHQIVDEAVEEYCSWAESLANLPDIIRMRQEARRIRDEELQRLLARMGPLTDEQRERLVAFSHRLTNKILHVPTMLLKQPRRFPPAGQNSSQ